MNYIRQMLCKHEFEYEEYRRTKLWNGEIIKEGPHIDRICKKCGWYKTYWKY